MNTKAVKYLSAVSLNERVQFLKILFRWKSSLWKLLWADFLWYLIAYISVSCLYRFYLINDPIHKKNFDGVVSYMNKVAEIVPLSFLLGFFVSTVLGRWWTIVNAIPWMTKPSFACQSLIADGDIEKTRDIRTTIMRYLNLAWILSLMSLSVKIKNRFQIRNEEAKSTCFNRENFMKSRPVTIRERMDMINSDEVVKKYFGKLIMEEEISVFEKSETSSKKPSYLIPLMWSTKLVQKGSKAGYLKSESSVLSMIQTFQANLETLILYNTFNVPLVYTQVIVIVVYVFLASEILSQQTIAIDSPSKFELFLPLYAIYKFLIYIGWFKVGLCFINPLGGEQIDLPLDDILDYNLQVSADMGESADRLFPDYLSDSLNDAQTDRIDEVFKKFRKFGPSRNGPA